MSELGYRNQTQFKVYLIPKHLEIITQLANYYGTTRTSIILLKFYFNRDKILTEQELAETNQMIQTEKSQYVSVAKFPEFYKELLLDRKFYFFSLNQYISSIIYYSIENGKYADMWEMSDKKTEKRVRKYPVNPDMYQQFIDFTDKTGLPISLALNFSFLNDFHKQGYVEQKDIPKNRTNKGIEFLYPTIEKLDTYKPSEREQILNKLIANIPPILANM